MTIIKLEASNVKRLRAVTITPQGSAVLIGGKNAQGKSSVLDAIAYALAGKDAIPTEPIRRGEKSASIVLETQEIVVTRKFTSKGSTLEVTNKDGMVFPSPQAVLDKLCSKVAFDPLAFVRLGDTPAGRREQLRQLRDLVGVDTSALDAERAAVFSKRTEVNRQVAAQHAVFSALPSNGPAPVDVGELLERMQDMEAANAKADRAAKEADKAEVAAVHAEARLSDAVESVRRIEAELAKAKAEVESARVALQAADVAAEAAQAAAKAAPRFDLTPIRNQIRDSDIVNAEAAKVARRKIEEQKHATLAEESERLTAQIAKLDADRTALITGAKMPIPGLGFSESEVTLGGIPLSQSSSAEQLRVGLAIAIAANPNMKVMLIRDGSLLDEDSLRLVEESAKAAGAQVWVEMVGRDGQCSVVIEDGAVKEGGE